MVKTKIIATLGPASSCETVIRKMIMAGVDVARLNFSHGAPQDMLHKIKIIRAINKKYKRKVRILGDLQGHRVRIGKLAAPMELKKNKIIWLTREHNLTNRNDIIPFDYTGVFDPIKINHEIFIDDGNIALKVIGKYKNKLKTIVVVGGLLKEHKGVNIPEAELDFEGLSDKDVQDIFFCKENNVDYIAQSFVRYKKDILEVKKILGKTSKCKVVAKIENRQALANIDEIIDVSDGIMIARGDLGVSLPIYEIPITQKILIKKCKKAGKFAITATQMLESMTENPRPTRAEATDVANAVLDGSDYVMLSAETAVGRYPVETVKTMNDILKFTERNSHKLRF